MVGKIDFLDLDFCDAILYDFTGLHLQGAGRACQDHHEDLHPTSEAQYKVQGGLFWDVVVRQGAVFELFARSTSAARKNVFLVLYHCIDILNIVIEVHLQGDGRAC